MKTVIEFTVPSSLRSYLFSGDDSGIDELEKIAADKFMAGVVKEIEKDYPDLISWHISDDSDDEGGYTSYHDVPEILSTHCQTINFVILTAQDYEETEMENDDNEWYEIDNFSFQGLPVEKIQLIVENQYMDLPPDFAKISEVKVTRKDGRIKFEGNFVVKFTTWDGVNETPITRDISFSSFMEFPAYWNEREFVGQLLALVDYDLVDRVLGMENNNNVFNLYADEIENTNDPEILARFADDTLYLKIA
jgi:hypothetical protein